MCIQDVLGNPQQSPRALTALQFRWAFENLLVFMFTFSCFEIKSFWLPPGADICRKLRYCFPAMLLQQHLLNVIYLGVWLHLGAPVCQQNSPWCAVIPVSRDASRAGASLEARSGGGRRQSRVEMSPCHCSAAPTWGWLGSLLLPREEIRLRGRTPGQREKQHVLLVCQLASRPARKHRLPDLKWLENTYIFYLETPIVFIHVFPKPWQCTVAWRIWNTGGEAFAGMIQYINQMLKPHTPFASKELLPQVTAFCHNLAISTKKPPPSPKKQP